MIQLKINNMDHKAVLTVPADYERVTLALWTLGLDRDPEKYTLRQLDAEFTYTTEEESQMVRLIDPRSSLMNALCLLSEMVYPPYPVAQQIHMAMLSVYWSISGITARNCGNGSSKATVPSRYRSKNRRRIRLSMHRLCHNLTK